MQNMIETKDLCKMYGNHTVVDHLIFACQKAVYTASLDQTARVNRQA